MTPYDDPRYSIKSSDRENVLYVEMEAIQYMVLDPICGDESSHMGRQPNMDSKNPDTVRRVSMCI